MGGLAALVKKGLDKHTLTFDSHEPGRSAISNRVGKCGFVGRVGQLHSPKKRLHEHTLTFESYMIRR